VEAYYGVTPGRWSSDDIIMDDVECDGTEGSLQACRYEDRHDCTLGEAASVACKPNTGMGWWGRDLKKKKNNTKGRACKLLLPAVCNLLTSVKREYSVNSHCQQRRRS
jgi:hypothetical protein